MKKEKINEILDGIDEKFVAEAAEAKVTRRPILMKVGIAAACIALAVTATAVMLPVMNSSEAGIYTENEASTDGSQSVSESITAATADINTTAENETTAEEIQTTPETIFPVRPYKENFISSSELAYIFLWEDMTDAERYRSVVYNGDEYTTRASEISASLLGEGLGKCTFTGYDVSTDTVYSEDFEIFEISGVSAEHLIAAKFSNEYTVFRNTDAPMPEALGKLMDAYALSDTLELKKYSHHNDYEGGGYFTLGDGSKVWDILKGCATAPLEAEDTVVFSGREVLSFTATSEALGIYKKVLSITRDGYLSTNIAEYGLVYFIGEDAAEEIFALAKADSTPAEAEPFHYTVAGIVTEIGEGYLLIDDSCVCENSEDGQIFKLDTTDITVGRYVKHGIIKEGGFVYVTHRGSLTYNEDWVINDVVSITDAILTDDGILSLE